MAEFIINLIADVITDIWTCNASRAGGGSERGLGRRLPSKDPIDFMRTK